MRGLIHQINITPCGIAKAPATEAHVTTERIVGDSWAHLRFHGGTNQAILLASLEDLKLLKELGYHVYPGALGENLTTTGTDMRSVRFGDVFRTGDAILRITKLSKPCRNMDSITKGIQIQLYDSNPGSPMWGSGAFYASVKQPGIIRPGDIIALADHDV
jgi:MOSC domain-containing protein YiiM